MIEIKSDTLNDFDAASSREWLETNGIGGFSSSTIIGLNTRRYHGLLTAATRPPVGRVVMLSKLEEAVVVDGRRYELSANQYPGVVHPQGFRFQTAFRLDPFPVFSYEVEGLQIEKSVFMPQGQNTVVISYALKAEGEDKEISGRSITLEVRPLIAFRDYHSTTHENSGLDATVTLQEGATSVWPYKDLPQLHFAHDPCERDTSGYWYRNFEYGIERERGLDFTEDLFAPFSLLFKLETGGVARILASTEAQNIAACDEYRQREISRRNDKTGSRQNDLLKVLTSAADQFIVKRAECKTIIAGYHWFSDWGRDTMIALPGLTLAMGQSSVAKRILAEFAKHVDKGMLPNRFPDAGETPEYNTVDATLWFFEAVRSLLQYTNDYEWVQKNLYKVLTDIVDWHVRGTRYSIHVDDDGLLYCGEPGVQLTWMDAKIGDWVVTPRQGKPVEIQALWYNALRVMEDLASRFNDAEASSRYASLAERASTSFNQQFWNEQAGCLYDVVDGDARDNSIRPNQVFAVSLYHSMVSREKAARILQVVEQELLTPRGLRTLSPADPRYISRYTGDPRTRDAAYHQGTVWPWLMGAYISAYSKTFGGEAGRAFATGWLTQFQTHLEEACLGQVSEIFDAAAPHAPRGCAAQAWSVAELLRVALEEVFVAEQAASALRTT